MISATKNLSGCSLIMSCEFKSNIKMSIAHKAAEKTKIYSGTHNINSCKWRAIAIADVWAISACQCTGALSAQTTCIVRVLKNIAF